MNAQDELRMFAAMKMTEIALDFDGVDPGALVQHTARQHGVDALTLATLLLTKTIRCQQAREQAAHDREVERIRPPKRDPGGEG